MLNPATHDLSYDPAKEAMRYRVGDVFDVFLTPANFTFSMDTRFGFIHITNVPDVYSIETIKKALSAPVRSTVIIDNPPLYRRRKWRIKPSAIPVGARNAMIANHELTVTWTQAKPYIRKKVVIDNLNAALDDDSTELVESDVA